MLWTMAVVMCGYVIRKKLERRAQVGVKDVFLVKSDVVAGKSRHHEG